MVFDNEGMELGGTETWPGEQIQIYIYFPYLYMLAILEEDKEVDYFDM